MHRQQLLLSVVLALMSVAPGFAAPPEAKDTKTSGKPVLTPMWKRTAIGLEPAEDLNAEALRTAREWSIDWNIKALKERQALSRATIPPAQPVGSNDQVVFFADSHVNCCRLRPLKWNDLELKAGDLNWSAQQDGGLTEAGRRLTSRDELDQWLKNVEPQKLSDLFFNRTLSVAMTVSDGHAHAIEEFGIAPAGDSLKRGIVQSPWLPVHFNAIRSYDLETGKLITRQPDLSDNMFGGVKTNRLQLSVPVSYENRWYLVLEENNSIHLKCTDWKEYIKPWKLRDVERDSKSTIWKAELFKNYTSVRKDAKRRLHAIHLVPMKDLVLCPTHLGRVVAVESKTGKIKWTHEYAPLDAKRFPTFAPEWVVVPPVVVGDKYIYAPADFPELLCLNVADGKKVWSVKKGDGLYPAVVGEQVLVIGEKTICSLDLKDGSEKWKTEIPGLPCGRGEMLGDTYLLPVSEPKTWRGMIAMVDVKNGRITEVLKPDKDEPIGNLVVHQEFLISQTLTEIAVFPIKKN